MLDLSHGGLEILLKKKKKKSYNNNTYIKKFNILGFKFPPEGKQFEQLNYLGYSIIGHYSDLEDIVFTQTDHRPWLAMKYDKELLECYI